MASDGVFILHKLFADSVYFKKKERKLHPVGFCWKEYIYTWADGVTSFIGFLIISGQRYVALQSGHILH